MRKLGVVRVIFIIILAAACVFVSVYNKTTEGAASAAVNPWNISGLKETYVTDSEGNPVQQQLRATKSNGGKLYYNSGDYVYLFTGTTDAGASASAENDTVITYYAKIYVYKTDDKKGYYTEAGDLVESAKDSTQKYAFAEFDISNTSSIMVNKNNYGTFKDKIAFYSSNADAVKAYEYDEEGNIIYELAESESKVLLFDSDSPVTAGAKKSDGSAISDASILGTSYNFLDLFDGTTKINGTIPEAATADGILRNVAWDDLSDDEKAAYVTTDDAKQLALALYYIGNKNYIETDYTCIYTNAATQNIAAGMNNAIDLNMVELRSNSAEKNVYYRQDFRVERDIPLFADAFIKSAVEAAKLELTCAERRYSDSNHDTGIYFRTASAEVDTEGKYYTNWNEVSQNFNDGENVQASTTFSANSVGTFDKYNLNNGFKKGYQYCDHIVALDTIDVAYCSFVDGKFNVYISLNMKTESGEAYSTRNPSNMPKAVYTTANGIRVGSGDDAAMYKNIELTLTLWSNGYYKSARQAEEWSGTVGGTIGVGSSFDYYSTFIYGKNNVSSKLTEFVDSWEDAKNMNSDTSK